MPSSGDEVVDKASWLALTKRSSLPSHPSSSPLSSLLLLLQFPSRSPADLNFEVMKSKESSTQINLTMSRFVMGLAQKYFIVKMDQN